MSAPRDERPDAADALSGEGRSAESRRDFLLSVKRWSKAVVGLAVAGSAFQSGVVHAWVNGGWVDSRGGWSNAVAWANGHAGWSNRGGVWVNAAGWPNHGGGWGNRGGWVNGVGGGWVNGSSGGGGWVNRSGSGGSGAWVNRRGDWVNGVGWVNR